MCDQAEMIKYINVARQFPTYYVNLIDRQLESFINDKEMPINEDMIYETNEGKEAWKEARRYLEKQSSLSPLSPHQGLNLSAKEHAVDLAVHNLFGHTGSDKSTFSERILKVCKKGQGAMAEIIGADFYLEGRNQAEMTILGLIIDDGVADRGHRKTIFNPQYRYVGCKSQIQNDKLITVFNLTENKLQLRTQHSTITEGLSSRLGNSTSGCFAQLKGLEQSDSNYSKSEVKQYSQQLGKKKGLEDLEKLRSAVSPGKMETGRSGVNNGKKVSEKKENIKIYHQGGSKVTEKFTQIYYTDGTMEQNIQRHTIYS